MNILINCYLHIKILCIKIINIMTIFTLIVEKEWYDFIRQGKKIVEGRLAKEKFKNMKKGDTIVFLNEVSKNNEVSETFEVSVKDVKKFTSFMEMIQYYGRDIVIPMRSNDCDALAVYRKFYSEADEKSLDTNGNPIGVIGIEI